MLERKIFLMRERYNFITTKEELQLNSLESMTFSHPLTIFLVHQEPPFGKHLQCPF